MSGCETTNPFRSVLQKLIFFRKFSEIIGKYCRGARRQISSDRFFKGEFLSGIFGYYWKILLEIETNHFRQFYKSDFFSEIIGKYCRGARRQITSDRFFKGDLFTEIFGNYRKFSLIIGKYCWSARRIFSDRFLKGDFFIGNFRKLLENIVRVRHDKSLHIGSLRVNFFRKFSEIIGKYCWSARRISSDRFLKGDFFSEIFGNY